MTPALKCLLAMIAGGAIGAACGALLAARADLASRR